MSNRFELELAEIPRLLDSGEPLTAMVKLGTVFSSMGSQPISRHAALHGKMKELVCAVDAQALARAHASAERARERLLHVSRFADGKYEVEEVVLMLTLRLEIAMAMLAARELCGVTWNIDLAGCDKNLGEVAVSCSRRAYRSAVLLIDKNWRRDMPFDVQLLGTAAIWSAGTD